MLRIRIQALGMKEERGGQNLSVILITCLLLQIQIAHRYLGVTCPELL